MIDSLSKRKKDSPETGLISVETQLLKEMSTLAFIMSHHGPVDSQNIITKDLAQKIGLALALSCPVLWLRTLAT